jgi:hypothetical protein
MGVDESEDLYAEDMSSDSDAMDSEEEVEDYLESTDNSGSEGDRDRPPHYGVCAEFHSNPMLAPSSLPESDNPNVKFYEVHTLEDDPWDYNDAQSTVLRQHGVSIDRLPPRGLPVLIPTTGLSVSPLYPSNHPTRMRTETIYHGHHDNHPLRFRDLELIPTSSSSYKPLTGNEEHAIANAFDEALYLMNDDTDYPRDIFYHKALTFQRIRDLPSRPRLRPISPLRSPRLVGFADVTKAGNVPGRQDDLNDVVEFLGQSVEQEEAKGEEDIENLNGEDEEDADENNEEELGPYWPIDPFRDARIRGNPWIPNVLTLRRIRRSINTGIRLLARMLITLPWRVRLDRHGGDVHHYFYNHCHIFRYLDAYRPILCQGYYTRCQHLDYSTPVPSPRQPLAPFNPLITIDEDEFLAQAANLFEMENRGELANAIRIFRSQPLPRADAVSYLFNTMYLDPLSYVDRHGARRPVVWEESDL